MSPNYLLEHGFSDTPMVSVENMSLNEAIDALKDSKRIASYLNFQGPELDHEDHQTGLLACHSTPCFETFLAIIRPEISYTSPLICSTWCIRNSSQSDYLRCIYSISKTIWSFSFTGCGVFNGTRRNDYCAVIVRFTFCACTLYCSVSMPPLWCSFPFIRPTSSTTVFCSYAPVIYSTSRGMPRTRIH